MMAKLTPDPPSFSGVEGTCPACRKLVRLQIIPPRGEVRCPDCGRRWAGPQAFCAALDAYRPGTSALLTNMLRSCRASGIDTLA